MDLQELLADLTHNTSHKVLASIVLIVLAFVLRATLTHAVLRQVADPALRRRWIVSIRNTVVLLLVFAFAAIWLDALRNFGIGIAAVAVAFVIATKEFIMCISGSILRAATNAYTVGDRIEMGEYRGDVVDFNLFTTTILEVGPAPTFHQRTGRAIVLPNSRFVEKGVINESYMRKYVVHVFTVPMRLDGDWQRAEEILLESANAECASFLDEAKRYMEEMERHHSLETLPTQPRVALTVTDPDRINLLVRFPSPVDRRGRLEQAILRRFVERFYGSQAPPQDLAERVAPARR
jgi:small-conductance mechanosensitive channel